MLSSVQQPFAKVKHLLLRKGILTSLDLDRFFVSVAKDIATTACFNEKASDKTISNYLQQKLNNLLLLRFFLVNTMFVIQTKTLMKSFSQLST